MEYTIYVNRKRKGIARDLEAAVRTGKLYKNLGEVLIEAPSGNISTVEELDEFLKREALFLARW